MEKIIYKWAVNSALIIQKKGEKMEGWVSVYRKLLENPIICKDSDYIAVWIYLLLNATHIERDAVFDGKRITLQPRTINYWKKSYRK